ncbi:oleoyl-ACP hydrolase [Deinococcus roseus]|uniref:Oleoyl-ACP hydrolase n=2 Tax=Deinococcus roseus TaxID=392414 RepID=A0ABQ2DBV6_9DEIO|nr:oleoyl-ACP hydrolase [Deinococcus roseus]
MFRNWSAPGLQVWGVQLPGRENRIMEDPFQQMQPLVDILIAELQPYLHEPYLIYGHSMGALVAYHVCLQLQQRGLPLPEHLWVSGCAAPLHFRQEAWHLLSDQDFIGRILSLGGTPPEVFEEPLLRPLVLKLLRADFQLVETAPAVTGKLGCPIGAVAGIQDPHATPADMQHWQDCTTEDFAEDFELLTVQGDHFLVRTHSQHLLQHMRARLKGVLSL